MKRPYTKIFPQRLFLDDLFYVEVCKIDSYQILQAHGICHFHREEDNPFYRWTSTFKTECARDKALNLLLKQCKKENIPIVLDKNLIILKDKLSMAIINKAMEMDNIKNYVKLCSNEIQEKYIELISR